MFSVSKMLKMLKRKRIISLWQLSYDERIKLISFILYSLGKRGKRIKTLQKIIAKKLEVEVPLHSLSVLLTMLKDLGIAFKVSKTRWKVKESLSEEDLLKLFQLSIVREEEIPYDIYRVLVWRMRNLKQSELIYQILLRNWEIENRES